MLSPHRSDSGQVGEVGYNNSAAIYNLSASIAADVVNEYSSSVSHSSRLLLKLGFGHGWRALSSQQVGMRRVTQILALRDMAMNDPITRHTLCLCNPLSWLPPFSCINWSFHRLFPSGVHASVLLISSQSESSSSSTASLHVSWQ